MTISNSLQTELNQLKEQNLKLIPDEVKAVMFADLKRMQDADMLTNAPKVGDKLISFALKSAVGTTRELTTLLQDGPVVITLYRGGWCPYCNLELKAYQNILPEIKKAGANLVAITPELPDESMTTSERHALEFEVLSDVNSDYIREIGLVFTVPKEIAELYKTLGIDIEKHNGLGQFDVPFAATLIIDTDGTVAYSFVDIDYTVRAEPEVIVAKLNELKAK